jgi:RNA 2',3'-cyclic 3'-phosphodiesterase
MARMRTFIAVDLGKSQKERCVSLQENMARLGADVKWVGQDNLHVTLLFLGEVDDRDVAKVCRAVGDCCAAFAPFGLILETVGGFPNPRRPRTIYVGVGEGAEELHALHDALEPPLLELGCYRREARPFTPHITLGRVKSQGERRGADADEVHSGTEAASVDGGGPVAAALRKYAAWQTGSAVVPVVLVLSSELTSREPVYTVLSRAKLQGGG